MCMLIKWEKNRKSSFWKNVFEKFFFEKMFQTSFWKNVSKKSWSTTFSARMSQRLFCRHRIHENFWHFCHIGKCFCSALSAKLKKHFCIRDLSRLALKVGDRNHLETRVARSFLVQHTKTGRNIPNDHKAYQIVTKYTKLSQNIPNCHKIYQIVTKYTNWP
jgi:hypothetical protein